MHCGPFANIAHGNNSLVADKVGAEARRLRRHRERLRLGHGHGEVPRHRLPDRRAAPERGRRRHDRPGAQAPRRRPGRRPRRDRARLREPAAPHRHRQGVRPRAGRRRQPPPEDTDEELEVARKLAARLRRVRGGAERGLRARRRRRDGAGGGGRRRGGAAEQFALIYTLEASIADKIEQIAHAGLRRRRRRLHARRPGEAEHFTEQGSTRSRSAWPRRTCRSRTTRRS